MPEGPPYAIMGLGEVKGENWGEGRKSLSIERNYTIEGMCMERGQIYSSLWCPIFLLLIAMIKGESSF